MSRRKHLLSAAIGCGLLVAPMAAPPTKRLVFNATQSAPIGFYWLRPGPPEVGELALVRPPAELARWMAMRRYVPVNVPLIKQVAAVEGQVVCVRGGVVSIDGDPRGKTLTRDVIGRPLSSSSVCRALRPGEVFFLNAEPRSLDSRYFGPLPRRCAVGRVTPLWTWKR